MAEDAHERWVDGGTGPVEMRVATVPTSGEVDFGDQDGVIDGDVGAGVVIRGGGHVRVIGSIHGEPGRECIVDVGETLVVEGSVSDVQLRARHIVIARDVRTSNLRADLGVEIRGDLASTTVSLGYRTGEIEALRAHRQSLAAVEKQQEALAVRIGANARRFPRDYPQVDLSFGRILGLRGRELHVDLQPFYAAAKEENASNLRRALERFYLKVMVGALTRANGHYVKQNPSRQKIFLKVIEELRAHLLLVVQGDLLGRKVAALRADRDEMVIRLGQKMPLVLRVSGTVSEDVRVRALALSNIRETPKGIVDMDETWAETNLVREKTGVEFESWNLEGKRALLPVPQDPLSHGHFRLDEGRVIWIPGA